MKILLSCLLAASAFTVQAIDPPKPSTPTRPVRAKMRDDFVVRAQQVLVAIANMYGGLHSVEGEDDFKNASDNLQAFKKGDDEFTMALEIEAFGFSRIHQLIDDSFPEVTPRVTTQFPEGGQACVDALLVALSTKTVPESFPLCKSQLLPPGKKKKHK